MKKKPEPARFVPPRDYKFDFAMRIAAERARAFQPKMISVTSRVNEQRQSS